MFNIPVDLSTAASLAASVNVAGLDFLNDKSILEEIKVFNTYESIITGMINDVERNMVIECVENGDISKLVEYVNAGKISTQTLIEYGKAFMIDVMNNGNLNDYNKDYKQIGGENKRYYSINTALKDLGFNDDFIYNLSNEFCKNLINNDAMYDKKGAVTAAVSTVGFLYNRKVILWKYMVNLKISIYKQMYLLYNICIWWW